MNHFRSSLRLVRAPGPPLSPLASFFPLGSRFGSSWLLFRSPPKVRSKSHSLAENSGSGAHNPHQLAPSFPQQSVGFATSSAVKTSKENYRLEFSKCNETGQVIQVFSRVLEDRLLAEEDCTELLEGAIRACRRLGEMNAAFMLVELYRKATEASKRRVSSSKDPINEGQPKRKSLFQELRTRLFGNLMAKQPPPELSSQLVTSKQSTTDIFWHWMIDNSVMAEDVYATLRALQLFAPNWHDLRLEDAQRPIVASSSPRFIMGYLGAMKDVNFSMLSDLVSMGVKELSQHQISADILEDFIFLKMGASYFSTEDKAVLAWACLNIPNSDFLARRIYDSFEGEANLKVKNTILEVFRRCEKFPLFWELWDSMILEKDFNLRTLRIAWGAAKGEKNHRMIENLTKLGRKLYEQNKHIDWLNFALLINRNRILPRNFLKEAKEHNLQLNGTTLKYLIRGSQNQPHSNKVLLQVIDSVSSVGGISATYALALRELNALSNPTSTRWLLSTVAERNVSLNEELLTEMIRSSLTLGDDTAALKLFLKWNTDFQLDTNSPMHQEAFSLIVKGLQGQAEFNTVYGLLLVLGRMSKFDHASFSNLMTTTLPPLTKIQVERLETACNGLIKSHTHHFSANDALWRLFIRKFELLDRPEISLRFAKLMESMGCEPKDIRSYNSLLGVYSENDCVDKVMALVASMKQKRVTPNKVTHHMLTRAFRHHPKDAKRILEKTKKIGWVPAVDAYTVVITALAYVHLNEALELLRELKAKHGSESLRNAYTSLILAIGKKKGALQEGLNFFRKAPTLGLTLDSVAYSAAISLTLHHNDFTLAEKLLEEAFRVVQEPELHLYNLQMRLYYQQQRQTEVLKVFSDLKSDRRKSPNAETYLTMIRVYFSLPVSAAEAVSLSKELFSELLEKSSIPSKPKELETAFVQYMQILGEQGQHEELHRVYDCLKDFAIVPDLDVYHQLLMDFGRLEQVRTVEKIYSSMLEHRVKPSEKTYDILINICRLDPLSVLLSESKNEEAFKATEPVKKAPKPRDVEVVLNYLGSIF